MGLSAKRTSSVPPVQRSADNVRKLAQGEPAPPKTGAQVTARGLAQSPNAKNAADDIPMNIVRELVNSGSPQDLAQLRQMVAGLSDRARANLMLNIAKATRDPQFIDPKDAGKASKKIALTPEGQMLIDVVFNGKAPPDSIINKPPTPGSGRDLSTINAEEDVSPLAPPDRPSLPEGSKPVRKRDQPKFTSYDEEVKQAKDGSLRVTRSDKTGIDTHTRRAIERIEEGYTKKDGTVVPPDPNARVRAPFDDEANTPEWARNKRTGRGDNALAAGTQTPQQQATARMHRLAETVSPHGGVIDSVAASDPLMQADLKAAGVSVFEPGNTGSQTRRHVATVRPSDHADAMDAFAGLRRNGAKLPNEQYGSAEEFARALVAQADQGGFDVTPITPGQRADATDLLNDAQYDPDIGPVPGRQFGGEVPEGKLSEKKAGPLLRQHLPAEMQAAKQAERAIMQEQTIAALTRKFEDIFGHQGWGENYKPGYRPATDTPAAVGTPAGDVRPGTVDATGNTSADSRPYAERLADYERQRELAEQARGPGRGDKNDPYLDPDRPLVAVPQKPRAPLTPPGRQPAELDPELTDDDLMDLHTRKVGEDGSELPGGEADSQLRTGRSHGDKLGVKPSKPRKEGGNAPGEYEDSQSFAQHNRENRPHVSDTDLKARAEFAKQWHKTVGGESARSSDLRRELRALTEADGDMTPERVQQIDILKSRLRFAELLDTMSKVDSLEVPDQPSTALVPSTQNKLDAAASDLPDDTPVGPEVMPNNGKPDQEPIDVEFEVVDRDPNSRIPSQRGSAADDVPTQKPGKVDIQGRGDMIPALPKKKPDVDPNAQTKADPWAKWKRGAAVGAGLAGGLGLYNILRHLGQPPAPPLPPGMQDILGPGGGGGGQGPGGFVPTPPTGTTSQEMTPEDRIRALQASGLRMRLNPNTQHLNSWTQ